MYNRLVLAGVVLVILVAGLLVFNNTKDKLLNSLNRKTSDQSSISNQPVRTDTIDYTDSGFSPSAIIVKTGTRVFWLNKSDKDTTVYSAFHPAHRVYPALNLGQFSKGFSVQLVFEKKGTYRYHNDKNTNQSGTITVE